MKFGENILNFDITQNINKNLKFLIFSIFFISGCASFYGLTEEDYLNRKKEYEEIQKYTDCLSFYKYVSLVHSKWSVKDLLYDIESNKNILLEAFSKEPKIFDSNDIGFEISIEQDVVNELNEKTYTPTYETILNFAKNDKSCSNETGVQKNRKFMELFENSVKNNIVKVSLEETSKYKKELLQNEKKQINAIESKYNTKFCSSKSGVHYIVTKQAPSNCMFEIPFGALRMIQQLPQGTLVATSIDITPFEGIALIIKNSIDSSVEGNIYDKGYIKGGFFKGKGSFEYTNITGIDKKVIKLERIE